MDNILVMLSGGVDSAYCMFHYLETTDLPIYTHHIILRCDIERRFHQETKATNSIIEWCEKRYPNRIVKNYRSNWWIDSRVMGRNIDLVLYTGAVVASRLYGKTAVATGRNSGDRGVDDVVVARKIWYSFAETYPGLVHETLRPGTFMTKLEVIDKLPKDLMDLTWSCRSSATDKQCGYCHACLANKGVTHG